MINFNLKKILLIQSGIIALSFLPTSGLFCKEATQIVDKCKCLGTTLYSDVKLEQTPYVVGDLTVSLNTLLADFSFVDSSTLSSLFDS